MPGYTIDPETLRERPDDDAAARARIDELTALGADGDSERVGWLRMLGRLDEARALAAAQLDRTPGLAGPDPVGSGAVGATLRLAHVLHWQGRFDDAEALFVEAHARAAEAHGARAASLHAYAHQHWAKLLFDAGRHPEALKHAERALAMREHAAPDLRASSEQTVTRISSALAATP